MDNIYTVASTSSSTTYGNIMATFKDLIIQKFPYNFFKDISLSSEIAYVNIRKRLGRNSLREISKLERPYMMINPQIQPPNTDLYLADTPLTKNFDNMEYGLRKGTLFQIINNATDHYGLFYKLNRDQIQFEITITVDTLIQQLDLVKYLNNHLVWERPFTVKTSLESMIPRDIIKNMGLISNIDIDKPHQTPIMLQMMNKYSRYPITYKMRNGTAMDEFFLYYNAEILINLTDLSPEQVNRRNMADDYYQITFRATVDFNLPGVFALIGDEPRPDIVQVDLESKNPFGPSDLIPLFTINNIYSKYKQERNGYVLHSNTRFQTERDPITKSDTLDLSALFDINYINVINRYNANNVPMETLLDIILLKDGEELNPDDWSITWNNLKLKIDEADDNATYCIIIYVNGKLFNENITNDIEDVSSDKPKA